MVVARLGLSLKEFEDLTPRELDFALKDKMRQEEDNYKTQWEVMRVQTMILLNPHLQKAHMHKSPEKFMPLPWDKKDSEWKKPEDVRKQSVGEMKSILMGMAKNTKGDESKRRRNKDE